MNTRSSVLVAIASTLLASALTAAQPTAPAVGYPASQITVGVRDLFTSSIQTHTITAGTARKTVVSLLGKPRQALTPDVFVYDNCEPDQSVARVRGCRTLVVTFSQDKVADLKFVNSAAATIIASNLREPQIDGHDNGPAASKKHDIAIPNK